MYTFVLILYLISILWCYSVVKKNDYNMAAWMLLTIFTGPISIILLLVQEIIKKKNNIKSWTLLVVITLICIIPFKYYSPIYIEETYCGSLLDKEKMIKDNITVNIKAKIYRTTNGSKEVNGIMELDNNIYILYFLLSENNGYTVVLTDDNRILGENKLHISEDLKSLDIKFQNLNSKYDNYTIKATLCRVKN